MCYNLGAANTSADPFTPGWEVNGGYWQWGRGVQAAAGPTGPGADQANEGSVSGWNTAIAANGSWSDTYKTGDDPCPAGYRVPTQTQWQAVHSHNTQTALGTWYLGGYTNYSAGMMFGSELMLPAAGLRNTNNGALNDRGDYGYYWSSTEGGSSSAWLLYFYSSNAGTYYSSRTNGRSVRCVAE
jgi:uncharacterized protein (TIGR02145 family)